MKKIESCVVWSIIACAAIIAACDPIQEELSQDGNLQLSIFVGERQLDTLKFDTLLTSVGSITHQFKIKNPNRNAILIDQIFLGRRDASEYSIIVNGQSGSSFENEIIYGNDSILVLVEVLIDPMDQDLPFLVKDSVVMRYNGNRQDLKLVAWGQDANFIDGEVLACDAIWDSPKPYVIYDFVLVDTLCTLTVAEGTRILMDNAAKFYVKGSLRVNGTPENKVIIRNTRFDPGYNLAPGQWDAIYFLEGSFNSLIDHAEIRNGQIGIRVGNPDQDNLSDLTISNTSIGFMSISGIRSFTSDINIVNTEVFYCQSELVGLFAGGSYNIDHCTFTNEPNFFIRDQSSVIISNFISLDGGDQLAADLDLSMTNSIIWGEMDEELLLAISEQANANLIINNNIIRTTDAFYEELENQISRDKNYPGFYSPAAYDYQIDSVSNARDAAPNSLLEFDLLGTARDDKPDIGAYERKDSIP